LEWQTPTQRETQFATLAGECRVDFVLTRVEHKNAERYSDFLNFRENISIFYQNLDF